MTGAADRLIIAGGGLAGCLTALALARLRPDVRFLLLERAASFGGDHTWSFFDPDVAESDRWLVDPLVTARWEAYDVTFPRRARTLATAYSSLSSARLDRVMRERLRPDQYRLGCAVEAVAPDGVLLAGGETLAAARVLDARGAADMSGLALGWQKFVGRTYRFDRPHGLARPIVMDATVDQSEGYRFVYCLPFSDRSMLVEDTYYSLSPVLDAPVLGERIEAYLAARGWRPAALEGEEAGVLPVALGGRIATLWQTDPGVPRIGLRGGFFHPTTGYTLPDAIRTALLVAVEPRLDVSSLHRLLRGTAEALWRRRRFYRLLNRMLFGAAPPPERFKVLEHFYRLDAGRVARFYAGRSTLMDKVRILSGRPPVPVGPALAALFGGGRHTE